jgi:hypothetical protein
MENSCNTLIRKPEGRRSLGRSRHCAHWQVLVNILLLLIIIIKNLLQPRKGRKCDKEKQRVCFRTGC